MDATVEWVDARERLPKDGMPVAAATSGRYPDFDDAEPEDTWSGADFWIVMPMRFAARHVGEDGTEYRDCFIDSDRIVRLPYGRHEDFGVGPITHWASLPALPGLTVQHLVGEGVQAALRDALG